MPWELVSGPDLGGGFLHQLTVGGDGPRAEVVFHAQEGGMDASGPPAGSPVPLGYTRVLSSCPIGGRECYHREFRLAREACTGARLAYNRMRFVFGPMLEQEYRGAPIPIDASLEELGQRLAGTSADSPAWWLAGRAAAHRLGAAVDPRDLDVRADTGGGSALATALHEYLIEPFAETEWAGLGPVLGGRAYLGTLRSGSRVSFREKPPARFAAVPEEIGAPREIEWGGLRHRSVSLVELWLDAARTGDHACETSVRPLLRAGGLTPAQAAEVVRESELPAATRARLVAGW